MSVGMVFGKLTVLGVHSKGKHPKWLCRCSCGTIKAVAKTNLFSANTTSCGCFQREKFGDSNRTHGLSETPEYTIWRAIKSRCFNKNDASYFNYGGKGITVCSRWLQSFENFISDMGPRPSGHSIDRKDGTKGYTPENCGWVTIKEQNRNRKNTVVVHVSGMPVYLVKYAEDNGYVYCSLYYYYKKVGFDAATLLARKLPPV